MIINNMNINYISSLILVNLLKKTIWYCLKKNRVAKSKKVHKN